MIAGMLPKPTSSYQISSWNSLMYSRTDKLQIMYGPGIMDIIDEIIWWWILDGYYEEEDEGEDENNKAEDDERAPLRPKSWG